MTAEYPFNDDLLLDEDDRARARVMWPNVAFAFQNDSLKNLFKPLDDKANIAKRRSRNWGFLAVGLVWASLLAASAEPLYEHFHFKELVIGVAAGAGFVGAAIGAFGVMFANSKKRWLERRFQTERLRQFNFQSVVFLADEILRAAESGDHTAFEQKREQGLLAFQQDIMSRAPSVYKSTIEESDEIKPPWLFHDQPSGKSLSGPHLKELLGAYAALRFQRQIDFANYKLTRDRGLFSTFPLEQAARLGAIALFCVLGLVILHLAVAWGTLSGADATVMKIGHVLVIWLAVTGLALRTLEEGLRPHREVERYRAYRAATREAYQSFSDARTASERLAAMLSMERVTFEEMRSFLQSNQEARFVM